MMKRFKKASTIRDVTWNVTATLTREQVIAGGKLAEFVGNIEADYKAKFPSGVGDVDWNALRGLFHELRRLKKMDDEFLDSVRGWTPGETGEA